MSVTTKKVKLCYHLLLKYKEFAHFYLQHDREGVSGPTTKEQPLTNPALLPENMNNKTINLTKTVLFQFTFEKIGSSASSL